MKYFEYKNLLNLFGGYFHQDWGCEFSSYENAMERFVHDNSADVLSKTKKELEAIMDLDMISPCIGDILDEMGCFYNSAAEWESQRHWLVDVLKRLQSGFENKNKQG